MSVAVVIRSARERTESLCLEALRDQVDGPIVTIYERPFLAALRRSIRIGIETDHELTLCVDADIIFAPRAVARMISRLRENTDAFYTCGYFLDKYYGEPKSRGAHLYRTFFLKEAERAIPPSEDVQRPETAMKQAMLERGYRGYNVEDYVLGLHGYGQYYRDTFRTIACRGQKSPSEFAALMKRFSRRSGFDPDLRVALWALVVGSEDQTFSLDAHYWNARASDLMRSSGLAEKSPLNMADARRLKMLARIAGNVPLGAWRQWKSLTTHFQVRP